MESRSLAVILPAYNEEVALHALLTDLVVALRGAVAAYQIIIVDDGSTDGTARIARHFSERHPEIEIITHPANRGLGAALRSGLSRVRMDYWSWLPTDGQFGVSELIKMLGSLEDDTIVVSYIGNADQRSLMRRGLSHCYRKAMVAGFGHDLRYFNGPALIPRKALLADELVSTGFSITAETLIRALDGRLHFREVPVAIEDRKGGQSKALTFRVAWNLVLTWMSLYWELRVRPVFK